MKTEVKQLSELNGTCPQCDKHCPLSNPGCGRGRRYAAQLSDNEQATAPGQKKEDHPKQQSGHEHRGTHEHHGHHGHHEIYN